jgi:hypothetical protein
VLGRLHHVACSLETAPRADDAAPHDPTPQAAARSESVVSGAMDDAIWTSSASFPMSWKPRPAPPRPSPPPSPVILPDDKHQRLRTLARSRGTTLNRLIDDLATVMLAEFDAETRFKLRVARGAGQEARGLALLDKAGGGG